MVVTSSPPPQRAGGQYVSPERLYLTRDGRVVKDGDPRAHSLLVAAGGTLPWAKAERYGLVDTDPAPLAEPDSKALAAPPQTKAQRGPRGTK